jgi:excisionase family DNA binding protein
MLTIKDAAKELKLSVNFVYRLVGSKLLRHERHGRGKRARIRIPEDALEEYRRSKTISVEKEVESPPPRPRTRKTEMSDLRRKHLGL